MWAIKMESITMAEEVIINNSLCVLHAIKIIL